jgi:hypothetical protein
MYTNIYKAWIRNNCMITYIDLDISEKEIVDKMELHNYEITREEAIILIKQNGKRHSF